MCFDLYSLLYYFNSNLALYDNKQSFFLRFLICFENLILHVLFFRTFGIISNKEDKKVIATLWKRTIKLLLTGKSLIKRDG